MTDPGFLTLVADNLEGAAKQAAKPKGSALPGKVAK